MRFIVTWNWHRWVFDTAQEREAFREYWKLKGESYNFTKR